MGTVKLYATLRQRAGGKRDIEIPWSAGDSVLEVIRELLRREPGLSGYILAEDGGLAPYVSVFLDGRDIRHLSGLATSVNGETEISIFPPVAGGGR